MRCTQPQGLSMGTEVFLRENAKHHDSCPTCGHSRGMIREQHDKYYGMFDEEFPLWQYTLKDGRTAKEYKQDEVWSSGPMIYLGLELSDGTKMEWSREELEANCGFDLYYPGEEEKDDSCDSN